MGQIAIIGAAGRAGRALAEEATTRGWVVLSIVRRPVTCIEDAVVCDATAGEELVDAIRGSDAVVLAITPEPGDPDSLSIAARNVLEQAGKAGVGRMIMVGGAGTLRTTTGGLLMDGDSFPQAARPTATAHRKALAALECDTGRVDWLYISPAASFLPEGERTGAYQLGTDDLLLGVDGRSAIGYSDFAVATLDQLEKPTAHRRRITAAWK